MSGFKGTPGPLTVNAVDEVVDANGELVADFTAVRPVEEERANAVAFAAVPRMIEALEAGRAYRTALDSCANNPERMASFCTAQGDDLDDLFERWDLLSDAALAAALGTEEQA